MSQFAKVLKSSVGKKFIMGATGLAMVIFLIEHLTGNLLLFDTNPDAFNEYSHFLISFGWLLVVVELILLAFFLLHVYSGISVARGRKAARPVRYAKSGDAGGPSKKSFASRTMIFTGLLTFVFVALHLWTFKYGPEYKTMVDGVEMRDLHRLVYETFSNPLYVAWYVGALLFLGFHLRHGFWSAFQSLGVNHPRYTPIIYSLGICLAIVIAAGFIGIPLWIFFTGA